MLAYLSASMANTRLAATGSISFGEGVVVLKRVHSSQLLVANVLGREEAKGEETVYLDRLLHDRSDTNWSGWAPHGAISTILTRSVSGLQPVS